MTEKEQDQYFIKTLKASLELYKEAYEYEKQHKSSKSIMDDYESMISSLEDILSNIKSIDDLCEMGEDAITDAFEAITGYAECFIISANEMQRKKDLEEYEKINELIYLFCDTDDEEDE